MRQLCLQKDPFQLTRRDVIIMKSGGTTICYIIGQKLKKVDDAVTILIKLFLILSKLA